MAAATVLRRPLLRLFAAVVGAAVLGACAGFESPGSGGPVVEAPAFNVGDRWVYHGINGFRMPVIWEEIREVVGVGADGITVRVSQKGPTLENTRTELWVAPGLVRIGAVFDDETRRFAVPLQRENFPLLPGKAWNQWVDNFNESTGKEGRINRYVRVTGWRTVTTPAGTFDAIQMRVMMRLDDEEFWRWPTECSYLISWAPAVRGIVAEEKEAQYYEKGSTYDGITAMRSQHGKLELVSFTPGKP